jgi:hypothetical protein
MERQFLDDGILTFSPLSASTARCEVASHLFPTNNLTTSGDAFCINGIQKAISKAYARAQVECVMYTSYCSVLQGT